MSPAFTRIAGVFLSYVVCTIVVTDPLIRQIGDVLPNDAGDPVLNTWILWWNTQAVPFSDRWWNTPIFFPLPDVVAYSEHLLGLWPLTAPIQWMSGNPVLAYNVAFLLSFPLSALSAYLLSAELTGRTDASWVAGLLYGFAPYRMDQLAHLQVLSSYWLPIVFLALHVYLRDGRNRWLVLFGAAYLLQGLSNGYLLLYVPVLVALWVIWFVPLVQRWRVTAHVAGVGTLAVVMVLPILLRYRAVHKDLGFEGPLWEIMSFSADLTSLLSASPMLSLWGALDEFVRPEGQLFPGLTVVCLLVVAVTRSRGRAVDEPPRWLWRLRVALAAAAGVVGLVLLWRFGAGPWDASLLGLHVSVTAVDKPLSVLLLLVTALWLVSPWVVAAHARRSRFVFYVLAATAMWVLAWGPFPTFREQQVLYHAPYSWLMALPGFDSVRVPARFWMLGILCLSAAGGLALAQLTARGSRR